MRQRVLFCLLLSAILFPSSVAANPETLVSKDGAAVSYDDQSRTWTIGNEFVKLMVGLDRSQNYRVVSLSNAATGHTWKTAAEADTAIVIAGSTISLGPSTGFRFDHDNAAELPTGVELQIVFVHGASHVRATRHYACYRQSPVVEMWTTFDTTAGAARVTLSDLNAWQLVVAQGTVRWINGLDVGEESGGAFTVRRRNLASGQRLDIGSGNRSSETAVPWFAIQGTGGEELYGGIMWAGAWAGQLEASGESLRCSMGLASMKTALDPGGTIEAPHGFVGVASKMFPAPAGMEAFIVQGVRGGRAFQPRVTYNTWFRDGVRLDEITIGNEMEQAARQGAGRFVIDAGWYAGAGANDDFDFTSGLGHWSTDADRFPSGLAALSDLAHALGMQFGIWVEPERVSLDTVFIDETVDEGWLAERDGRYDPDLSQADAVAAQICLGDRAAREWVLEKLSELIDQAHADYIKWDNNFWINCNRDGHGHGSEDGNFAHIAGLYALLAALGERYPNLIIENCASGGNRLDVGLLRYTDVAWMDDHSTPSVHVRHNLEGLASVFPPAYLLSFLLSDDSEPLHDSWDLPLYFRSRMPGLLGLAFSDADLSEDEKTVALRETAIARTLADIQADASAVAFDGQAGTSDDPWDVIQETSASTGNAIIFAFQVDPEADQTTVYPLGLLGEATYEVRSVDAGVLGTCTGSELMEEGIEINVSSISAAHILVLTVVPAVDSSPLRASLRK